MRRTQSPKSKGIPHAVSAAHFLLALTNTLQCFRGKVAVLKATLDLWPPTSLVNAEFLADRASVVPPCVIGPRTGTGGDC